MPQAPGGTGTIYYTNSMSARELASSLGDTRATMAGTKGRDPARVDKLIPVDVYLPGCPLKPEAVIDAITKLRKKVSREIYEDRFGSQQKNRCFTTTHKFYVGRSTHSERFSSSWLAWLDTNVVDKVDLLFFSISRRNEGTGRTMLCSGKEVGAPA
ncbi:hypothetical protein MKW94_014530 [Papaver nudicaule]|uniref:NADH:ubiquinone oxidoreductase-like 20kDa subunit domain-containing protein n=1 Tax=Papaver nudicaule TaxID=74823 RepID=A0AA41UZL3_PAPNU|nr:hypothetical protein [Papaver nudicaule]